MTKTFKLAKSRLVTQAEAIAYLRANLPAEDANTTGFARGDAVLLDTGWVGVVHSVDAEESLVNVIYLDGGGHLCGPAYGYRITKLPDDGSTN